MFSIKELKRKSKEELHQNLSVLILMGLVVMGAGVVLNLIPVIGTLASFVITPLLTFNMTKAYLAVTKNQTPEIKDLFSNTDMIVKLVITTFLTSLYIALWSLLFTIPGIIKGYSYSQTIYILAEHPELTPSQAITESRRIMDGNKMNLFKISLTFIGWMALCMVTFGLASIYVVPYLAVTTANFYHTIKDKPHYTV